MTLSFDFLDRRPLVIAIAGSNGAGKSTFYASHLDDSGLRFVNVDVFAADLAIGDLDQPFRFLGHYLGGKRKDYAEILGMKFAYSTNGHEIIEFDHTTRIESELTAFPTQSELWQRIADSESITEPARFVQRVRSGLFWGHCIFRRESLGFGQANHPWPSNNGRILKMKVIVDLCVVPMGVGVSVGKYVVECQKVLEEAGLNHQVHAYGTNIEGDWDEVFAAVKRCHERVHEMGAPRITTSIKVGTRTDREQSMQDKIDSVV